MRAAIGNFIVDELIDSLSRASQGVNVCPSEEWEGKLTRRDYLANPIGSDKHLHLVSGLFQTE
jgi:hypothetical protein